ncbi:hypothetical protein [Phyllobacterium sp. SB3]|uniref:hypothetical protein n=1 Tax=Phyllobacterium sp. SB3 TaxID=3156073 RepID=UPI0032B00D6B
MKQNTEAFDSSTRRFLLSVYLVGMTLAGVVLGLCWYMSPLALGFAQWPTDPVEKYRTAILYDLSFYAGIPLVVFGPMTAIVPYRKGFDRAAFVVPRILLATFMASAAGVLMLLK